ncbi:non-hydrolyzing UDP-N-acetylglucosamine 2-epimerase [Humitalea sp. 24SJ18S-53]|uniref:non-hydrolyzing UDP-N-acetylglucosamine 2-epimerase n=1 Tax=Humitalea sp. 24SJ18S-53 TaxID=3422307 RepID=UPI003D672E28
MSLPVIHLVVAARPNLPKIAALWHALAEAPPICRPLILHTGQHHDAAMFGQHLADLDLPAPHIALGVAAGAGHAALTGQTMMAAEAVWRRDPPALVVVAGDVDGTLAAALAARKLGLHVAHLEAGLRSGDRLMPEEVNRCAVDAVSDILWAPDRATAQRLVDAGHPRGAVRAVGNAMVDSIFRARQRALAQPLPAGLMLGGYGLVTLHRPSNVDDPAVLAALLAALGDAARHIPLVWPVHPRTAQRLGDTPLPPGVMRLPPQGYLAFAGLLAQARFTATDSGGVQEEATALGIPCLTLRDTTERPVTLEAGGNRLVTPAGLAAAVAALLATPANPPQKIPLWDGRAGARMVAHLREVLGSMAMAA